MKITIFNPAPLGEKLTKWGDYAFGRALQRNLEALGARVAQRYWPDWSQDDDADVHLVLRGKRAFPGVHRRPALLWMISHPASASAAEFTGYDFVLLGSQRHLSLLGAAARAGEFAVARQCTEFAAAEVAADPGTERRGVVFVANSRGVRRPILHWALDTGVPVELYGRQWRPFGMGRHIRSEHVENDQLPALYRASRLGLNDHWTDMRYFGYVSNRIYDCFAAGLPVVTDEFPELREVFGESLLYVSGRPSMLDAYQRALADYDGVKARTDAWWQRLGCDYTFQARARLIADIAQRLVSDRGAGNRMRRPQMQAPEPELARVLAESSAHHVLHVMPACRLDRAGAADQPVEYLTAGCGCGPWTVEIDEHLSAFSDRSFDTIVVDDVEGWQLADAVDVRALLEAVRRCLRRNGRLLVHAQSSLVRQRPPCLAERAFSAASPTYREYRFEDAVTSGPEIAAPDLEG